MAAEHQRLGEDRHEDGRGVEPEGAQRRDLPRPRGHRRVHRQDGAEDGADAHERRNAEADRLDQPSSSPATERA